MIHSKVLKYYESQGLVEAPHYTLPGYQVNLPLLQNKYIYDEAAALKKRINEKIPYNDCLYRNMNKYKYLAILEGVVFIIKSQKVL